MGARILAVEDTPHNLDLMTYLLEAGGHTVRQATTGSDGVSSARSDRPDLVVLDVQLPDMDGYRVLSEIRADPALFDVPVVAVTAYAMVGDRDHALQAGFDGYLSKPLDPETFVTSIESHLAPELRGTPMRPNWADDDLPPEGAARDRPRVTRRVLAARVGAVNLAVARSTLEPHGYTFIAVETAAQARAEAVADRPDLVLVELDARGTGTQLLSELREADELAAVPIAIIAAREAARQPAAADVTAISSPIDPEILLSRLDALTTNWRA